MNALSCKQRRQRNSQPILESLDSRIVLSTIHPTIGAEGRAGVAIMQLQKRHEKLVELRIERQEKAIERQELRLARLEARFLAHHPAFVAATTGVQVSTSAPVTVSLNNFGTSTVSAPTVSSTPTSNSSTLMFSSSGALPSSTGATATGSTSQPLPSNVSVTLDAVYAAFQQDASDFPANLPTTNEANLVVIQGDNVGIEVHDGNPSDFYTLVTELQNAGMQITSSSATYGVVVGMLPIAELPNVAALPQTTSMGALMQPVTH
jgi:hypothetical protein